jgi:curved DNA-binding protein CbpA
MAVTVTLYETLEVSQRASQEVIKAAYRVLVNKYHPDRHPNDLAIAAKCAKINSAYDTLSDPVKKKQYDATIEQTLYGPYVQPVYKSYTPPQQPPPPPPPPKPVYVCDPKWEKFLAERPDWAKNIIPPDGSWAEKDIPIRQVPGGFTDVRPDLEMWGQQIVRTGQQSSQLYSAIEAELVRTWGYFAEGCGSLTQSLIREVAREWCNRARGIAPHSKVQFGV